MKISNVEDFLKEMDGYDAEYQFDIEDGWTHEDVCKNSYTDNRLAWVFKHTKAPATNIKDVTGNTNKPTKTEWYSISGQKLLSAPTHKGVYIKTSYYEDGSSSSEKYYIGSVN